jgi:rare lipoprotein A
MIFLLSTLIGIASWYGSDLEGRLTASGEPFNPAALTAASWHHELGAWLEVSNPSTGQAVIVRINDRGPARRLGRIIDLSESAFAQIADLRIGLVTVEVREILPPQPTKAAEN